MDAAGNVYFTYYNNGGSAAIGVWTAANSNVTTLSSDLSYNGYPPAVAVDHAGNLYIAEPEGGVILTWTAANNALNPLAWEGLYNPEGVAVDGEGNVYIADTFNNAIKEWTAANSNLTTLVSSGLSYPSGVAVDATGNVYIADTGNSAIREIPYAFVDPTPKLEAMAGGSDVLPTVLPATENLLAPFVPTSDQPWLTISGVTNGVVSFSFTANTGPARTARINLLGQIVAITQGVIGTPPSLTRVQILGNGALQFAFTNNPSASFTVVSTSDLSSPFADWTVVGTASNIGSEAFEFTDTNSASDVQRFYAVRSP